MRFRSLVLASSTAFAAIWLPAVAFAQERSGPVALDFTPLGFATVSRRRAAEAPADVSFGIYPLSVMGIENAIKRADARVENYARGIERFDDGPIAYSVIALHDWQRRYPADPWIAKDLFALAHFYRHVGTVEAVRHARDAGEWLREDYPNSRYAQALP